MRESRRFAGVYFTLLLTSGSLAGCDVRVVPTPQWPGQWQEFRAIVGQPVDSPVVQQFITRYKLECTTRGRSGIYDLHKTLPFSVIYRDNKITRVTVDIDRSVDATNQGPVFKGELPLGLSRDNFPEDVIRKLGQPAHQPERDYLSYETPNAVISFDRRTHRLNQICLDADD